MHANLCLGEWRLVAASEESKVLRGTLFAESSDSSHLVPLNFSLQRNDTNTGTKQSFQNAKDMYYQDLVQRGLPGSSWFRHQLQSANPVRLPRTGFRSSRSTLEDSFSMFSGGRAVAENLKLDQQLPVSDTGDRHTDLSTIEGITIQEFDWKQKLGSSNPKLDFLASYIPHDQYGLFFDTFSDFTQMIEQTSEHSLPIVDLLETTAEDAGTKQYYQDQLLLPLDDFAKKFGEQIISDVALTSSDPYFRTGTDMALLFKGKDDSTGMGIDAVSVFLRLRYQAAINEDSSLKHGTAKVNEFNYQFVRSNDRKVSSYVAKIGNIIVVTNSLKQLEAVATSATDPKKSMKALDEYRYFRTLYPLGDSTESAFLMITDAAIRKWSGPKWRITAARRTQAAAVMGDLRTEFLEQLHKGTLDQATLKKGKSYAKLPDTVLVNNTIRSKEYGSLEFLTPISELQISKASANEVRLYTRFRDSYQNRWARYFDPIAVRFILNQRKMSMDLSIIPLIRNTDYRDFLEFTGGQFLDERAPGFSSNDIFRFTIAPRQDSRIFQQASGFSQMVAPALANPLGWIGNYISIGVGKSNFWDKAAKQKHPERFLENNYQQIPASITFDVKDTLRLTGFLTGIRAMVTQSAPGLTVWENLEHAGKQYVKISGQNRSRNESDPNSWAIFYGVLSGQLIVSLDEAYVKSSLEQKQKKPGSASDFKHHVEIGLSQSFVNVVQSVAGESYREMMKQRCFDNLHVLNEWKRGLNVTDPIGFHRTHWKSTLRCPGGGGYRWNEKWHTMESTLYGHPGEPKLNTAEFSDPLKLYSGARFTLTFEDDGLRTTVSLNKGES